MKFCNLPKEMDVGAAYLMPVERHESLKQYTCLSCEKMSQSIFVCCKQHVLCKQCRVAELWPSKFVWCPICKKVVTATEAIFNVETLAKLKFECACSFRGSLAEVRKHLLRKRYPQDNTSVCGSDPGREQATETLSEMRTLDDRIRNLAIEQMNEAKEKMIEEVVQRLDDLFTPKLTIVTSYTNKVRSQMEDKIALQKDELIKKIEAHKTDLASVVQDKIDLTIENIRRLEKMVFQQDKTIETCANLSKMSFEYSSAPTGYLWFNFTKLFNDLQTNCTSVSSPPKRKVVAGIPVQVYVRLSNHENQTYFGMFAKFLNDSTEEIPTPLHRCFTLKVHDMNGADVASLKSNSFSGGEYFFACGPSSSVGRDETASGNSELISVERLHAKKCVVEGMVCVSVTLDPMT